MNLGQLRTVVCSNLNKTDGDPDAFNIGGVDLLNLAINNARRVAQGLHDFERFKCLVDVVIDGVAGGELDTAYLHGGDAEDDLVEIYTIMEVGSYDETTGEFASGTFTTYDNLKVRQRSMELSEYDPDIRYPGDWTPPRGIRPNYVILGDRIFSQPLGESGEESTVGLYVVRYMGDVPSMEEDNSDFEDWFMKKGGQWLQWQTIIELNHISKDFVFRQEGNLPPPEKMAALCWDAVLKADTYQFSQLPEGHL